MTRDPLAFTEDALCRQIDSAIFFVDVGGSTREAKAVCRRCDARTECLTYALEHDEQGVWGGTSDLDRLKMQRPKAVKVIADRDLVCVTCHGRFYGHPRRIYCDTCRLDAKRASCSAYRKRAA